MSDARPLIGLTTGDPAGVGPELVLRALASETLAERMRLLVIGPGELRPRELAQAGADGDPERVERGWLETPTRGPWTLGRPQAAAGHAALAALRAGADLAQRGFVDALVTGPVSKEALHLAGERVEGQTELFERWSGARVQMLGCADRMRVLLLSRHVPLVQAIASITISASPGRTECLTRDSIPGQGE